MSYVLAMLAPQRLVHLSSVDLAIIAIYFLAVLGIAAWQDPSPTVLANLHAPVWWGSLMAVLGGAYINAFRPRRSS
jgi:hypothetical protein